MIELSTRFSGITTSTKAKSCIASDKAADRAKANLRYIDRSTARRSGDAIGAGNMRNPDGTLVRTAAEGRAAMRRAIDARVGTGGKNGRRVAEKLIFSLPNDFAGKPAREALRRIMRRIVGDSEAMAYGVIHTDRPDNLHCHILAVDGPESLASAKQRRPGAQRVRRRDHLAMNERGKPRALRALIAEEINAVAKQYGLTMVEHRSFIDRGIVREPGAHMGPQKRARMEREAGIRRERAPLVSQKGRNPSRVR